MRVKKKCKVAAGNDILFETIVCDKTQAFWSHPPTPTLFTDPLRCTFVFCSLFYRNCSSISPKDEKTFNIFVLNFESLAE